MSFCQALISIREIVKTVSEEFHISKGEAELIVATLLEQPRFGIYYNKEIDTETVVLLNMRLQQLKKGMPIEYITKKVQFMDYLLTIYPGIFIPRIETEYFVELIGKLVIPAPKTILEIGTGCGAIAISLTRVFPEAQIFATDISLDATANALENIQTFNVKDRITLVRCDLYEGLSARFDLIVSNPPYIPTSRIQSLPRSVRDFEPIRAIDGGHQGVQFIKRLIREGKKYLGPDGMMAIEIDEDEVGHLKRILETDSFKAFIFKKDLFGRFRYLFIGDSKNEKG